MMISSVTPHSPAMAKKISSTSHSALEWLAGGAGMGVTVGVGAKVVVGIGVGVGSGVGVGTGVGVVSGAASRHVAAEGSVSPSLSMPYTPERVNEQSFTSIT